MNGSKGLVLRLCLLVLTLCVVICPLGTYAENDQLSNEQAALWGTESIARFDQEIACKSAILMEANTGTVLYEMNADQGLPPASVTKIMTLLLVMEAIEQGKIAWDEMITASAYACSMGGSQIYLKEGERMSVEDMVKSVVIASANDAAVALAEHIAGSEESFVKMMNDKALQLDMLNTKFENTNGLDDTAQSHYTSARDIAIMSRELIRHQTILQYSSIWMDTIRDGAFGLTNTNRLVRFYQGCNGLKTGSTAKAGFCVSVSATRNGMTLLCVIMGAENRDARNKIATQLLDWGFANYGVFSAKGDVLTGIPVKSGTMDTMQASYGDFCCLLPKALVSKVKATAELESEFYNAPILPGDKLGQVVYTIEGEEIGKVTILSVEEIPKISYWGVLYRLIAKFLLI